MDLVSLSTFAIALFIAAASPGPGMTALVARALGVGFWGTMPMLIGLTIGDLTFLFAAAFGLAALAKTFGTVFLIVKLAGAAYLIYLAWKLWTTEPQALEVNVDRSESVWKGVGIGLAITLGNPKTIGFYLALLPTLIDLQAIDTLGFIEMAGVVVVVLLVVGVAYVGAATRAREMFRNPRARRILDRTAGTMLAGAAVAVAAR